MLKIKWRSNKSLSLRHVFGGLCYAFMCLALILKILLAYRQTFQLATQQRY